MPDLTPPGPVPPSPALKKKASINPVIACLLIFGIGVIGFALLLALLFVAAGSFAGCIGPNLC